MSDKKRISAIGWSYIS